MGVPPRAGTGIFAEHWHQAMRKCAGSNINLFLFILLLNAVWLPYAGLQHDSCLYGIQVWNRVADGQFADDLYLRFGSQDRFTIFSPLIAPLAHWLGVQSGFLVAYVACKSLFLFALQRFVLALLRPRWLAALALVYAALAPLPYGGLGTFQVNEGFLTARILGCAIVLFGLEHLIRGRVFVAMAYSCVAMFIHPLMALPGLLVCGVYLALQHLTARQCGVMCIMLLLAAFAILLTPALGTRLFGDFDHEWRSRVHAASPYAFPSEWLLADWFRIVFALGVVAFGSQVIRGARHGRFTVAVVTVAALGILGAFVVTWTPYALPFQVQPFRALWILQLTAVPVGFASIRRFAARQDRLGKCVAIGVAATFVLSGLLNGVVSLSMLRVAFSAGLLLGLYRLARQATWPQAAWMRLACLLLYALCVSTLSKTNDGSDHARVRELDFARQFLQAQWDTQSVGPTIHWPAPSANRIWFGLGANSYFSRQQMAGSMFNRETAMEGRRRAAMTRPFDLATFHAAMPHLAPWQRNSLCAIYESPSQIVSPSLDHLLRLCSDKELDYAILKQRFDGLYSATNGEWYVYDCRRIEGMSARTELRFQHAGTRF